MTLPDGELVKLCDEVLRDAVFSKMGVGAIARALKERLSAAPTVESPVAPMRFIEKAVPERRTRKHGKGMRTDETAVYWTNDMVIHDDRRKAHKVEKAPPQWSGGA